MSEWTEKRLGEIVEVVNGYAFKSKDFKSFCFENDLPVLKIKNVANGDVNLNEVQYHTNDTKFGKFTAKKNDLLIALTGNHPEAQTQVVGSVSKLKMDIVALINQRVAKIIIKENLADKNFIYYSFKLPEISFKLASKSSGSANQANISKSDIENLVFKIPPLPEQQAIASVLSSLDDKIDLLHRQNKTLEAMAETLFRQWFIEEAKADWEIGKLPDEFTFIMGQSPSGSSFNEEKIGVPMFQGNADFNFRFPTNRVYTTQPKRFAEPLDTLISVRAPVGAQNMAKEKCCIGRGVATFRSKINPDWYTYTYYKLNFLMTEIKKFNDEGTVFGSISKSDFEKIEVIIPDNLTVENFEKLAKPVNDKIISNVNQIQTLKNLRDTLLPKLMSGEIRVQH
ncbi:Type I restriction-modification system, specificity subunit S [Moraxellaceae bacterium 17A]|nr:Type I restriction-modification system, specificity subunit S [Moraxellaceae bacterium 17A]